jgi:hypothetical protein
MTADQFAQLRDAWGQTPPRPVSLALRRANEGVDDLLRQRLKQIRLCNKPRVRSRDPMSATGHQRRCGRRRFDDRCTFNCGRGRAAPVRTVRGEIANFCAESQISDLQQLAPVTSRRGSRCG